MTRRPWKLKAYIGGIHGHVADTRSFETREARDKEVEYLRHNGWTVRVWRASSAPKDAPR